MGPLQSDAVGIFFVVLFAAFTVADVMWWRRADAQLRRLRHARIWRTLLGGFIGGLLLYIVGFVVLPRQMRLPRAWLPTWYLALIYLWHLLVLPATLLLFVPGKMIEAVGKRVKHRQAAPAAEPIGSRALSRRQFLGAAAVAAPPLVAIGATAYAMPHLHEFRIRHIDVPLRNLPPALDGLTIAHLSDVHIGKFTTPAMLRDVVTRANALRTDLVFYAGDLIDLSLGALDDGIAMLRNLDPRGGFFVCEGNHDLIQNRDAFESRMRASGLPFLLDEARTIEVRGVKVQILGQRWDRSAAGIVESTERMIAAAEPDAFPILLAHHPHAWTLARERIPLTLAGHTHGGQLMLNDRLGAGPIMFKYWSGLYCHHGAALIVSNGIGNWFPLRIHAPAEIVHMTLRRA